MKIYSVQNNINFNGLIVIDKFHKYASSLQERIVVTLNENSAYRLGGTAKNNTVQFYGSDTFSKQQKAALKELGVEAVFLPAKFSDVVNLSRGTRRKK